MLLVSAGELFAQSEFTFERDEPPTMEMLVGAREVFEYEVSYSFFTLGWIKVELLPDTTFNGEHAFHMRTTMRSNSKVPLIGTSVVNYENLFQFNEKWPFSFLFWRDDIHDEEFDRYRIEFDRDSSLVHFFERGEFMETLELVEPASGGDTIFYYSRMFAGIDKPYKLPVYIENELGHVESVSSAKTEKRSYDAFDDEIETYRSDGVANINGPFGFRGKFTSWFATDDLRVPVEAHARVIFGNVKVRLISYEKNGTN